MSDKEPIKIPDILVRRLKEAGLNTQRFLKLDGKTAIEKDWPDRLYEPEELNQVWSRNYGVAAGDGLVLIDGDKEPLSSWLETNLPRTFRVLSPGHQKPHYYLKLEGVIENLTLEFGVDEKDQPVNMGHVQANRKYLVGPGSIHPNGGVYEIIDDGPIATIPAGKLLEILAPFTNVTRYRDYVKEVKKHGKFAIDITKVIDVSKMKRQGDEYYGSHPIHGSETGHNFWVNPTKDLWCCFRHNTGGSSLSWIAVEEKIIKCEEALPGALKGEKFKRVLEAAVRRSLIKEEDLKKKYNVKREEAPPKISEGAVDRAKELLRDPEAFIQYLHQCLEYRLTGEWKNRQIIFNGAAGASVRTCLIRIEGPNSVGKKMMYYWIPEVFGEDKVVILSSATAAWLKRKVLGGFDTRGKIFILIEERGDKEGSFKYNFEQIYSEDKIRIGFNIRGESGDWEPIEVELQGPLCFITTSTELQGSFHAKTREWTVTPDESLEQTQRIDKWINWRELLPVARIEEEKKEIEVIRAYLSLLKAHKDYRIPFIEAIDFKMRTVEDRRKKPDFLNLMRYACHIFQGSLPIDDETDIVFAMPFIFHYVLSIADEMIFVSRGGLNNMEKRMERFIKDHPQIYKVTAEGKTPRKYVKDEGRYEGLVEEKTEGFTIRAVLETGEFTDIHENTVKNALNGLAGKRRLTVLKTGGRGVEKIYGNLVVYSKDLEKALIPEITPFSTDFLSSQVHKIIRRINGGENGSLDRAASLIQNCGLVNLGKEPKTGFSQPEWCFSDSLRKQQGLHIDEKEEGKAAPSEVERLTPEELTPEPEDMVSKTSRKEEKRKPEKTPYKAVYCRPCLEKAQLKNYREVGEVGDFPWMCVECGKHGDVVVEVFEK